MAFQESATVKSTEEIAQNTFQVFFDSPQIAGSIKPGQFINILPSTNWDMVMRRPMSVSGVEGNDIGIIFKAVGPGTNLMRDWSIGERVELIGPLGNSWGVSEKLPVLIGGGVGIAPTWFLHNQLNEANTQNYLIMGSRVGSEHFIEHTPEKKLVMCTDDGSFGVKGNVLNGLDLIRDEIDLNNVKLFVCGPAPMMEAVREVAVAENIECEIALETVMACGFGICQGCTMEYVSNGEASDTYRNKFGLVCMDGPVFKAGEIKSCYL
ncbi:MAG: dihydroorotate dehydrogenase electron transfer subunit [Flavobacteriales bacterium]|nr:dihydroorotate dehydrogenase electron transfer subunit [Flavobacteriales bacterium]